MGGALAAAARQRGIPCHLASRDAGWEAIESGSGPILVATRNDDLPGIVQRVPARRHDHLVFVQNGMLRPWLASAGLSDATRGLLFFAVAARGAPIQPGPPSPFTGPVAEQVVAFLRAIDVPAELVSPAAFTDLEHEKLLWNTSFGLLCQALQVPVGDVVRHHRDLLVDLVRELDGVARRALDIGVELDTLVEKLCAYSLTIPDYQGAVKEWRWRNGWYVDVAAQYELPLPVHTRLCEQAGVG